ncbi:unnamed protein product [Callosobruchus maculatus]|uniref:Uncharacterized protein n=1 Tax=Callosobruchus maculatus TaxID=64391 RepID=A0A653BVJ9_CALMS|nr:unnamed protein product [Callosobruchus maculatus]
MEEWENSCLNDGNEAKSEFCRRKTEQYSTWLPNSSTGASRTTARFLNRCGLFGNMLYRIIFISLHSQNLAVVWTTETGV